MPRSLALVVLAVVAALLTACQSTPEPFIGEWHGTSVDDGRTTLTVNRDGSLLIRETEDSETIEGAVAEWQRESDRRIRWSRLQGSFAYRNGTAQLTDENELLLFSSGHDRPIVFRRALPPVPADPAPAAAEGTDAEAADADGSADADYEDHASHAGHDHDHDHDVSTDEAAVTADADAYDVSPLVGRWELDDPDAPDDMTGFLRIAPDGTLLMQLRGRPMIVFNADWSPEGDSRVIWTKLHGTGRVGPEGSADLIDDDHLLLFLGTSQEPGMIHFKRAANQR